MSGSTYATNIDRYIQVHYTINTMKAVKAGPRHLAMMSDVEQCKQNDMQ